MIQSPAIPLTLAALLIGAAWDSSALAEPPQPPPGKGEPDPIPHPDDLGLYEMIRAVSEPATAEELLDALEAADKDLRTFQAEIMYDRRFLLQGDRHIRYGDLVYRRIAAEEGARPRRAFAVRFRTLIVDDEKRDDRSEWVFDGEWLVERRPVEKQYIARQVARPDDPVDPLAVGEGPIPFPIGQKTRAILERYEATLLKPTDGLEPEPDADEEEKQELASLRAAADGTYQLRLIPKSAFADQDDFKEIRLWYTKERFLPRLARTVNRAGDESIVLLINAKVNEELPAHAIQIAPPPEKEGWDVQIDPGRFRKDGGREAE